MSHLALNEDSVISSTSDRQHVSDSERRPLSEIRSPSEPSLGKEAPPSPVFIFPSAASVSQTPKFTFRGDAVPAQNHPEDERFGFVRSASFTSRPLYHPRRDDDEDNDSLCLPSPTLGCSRRMSRSLPELRDVKFVSVLPDLEEEESEESEEDLNEIVYEKKTRSLWHRKLDFLLCSVCQALGLSNIWRFPYYCYSNGGGSFLIVYLALLLICGIPLLCMELAVGQVTQCGPITALGQLCPFMKGIGVSNVIIAFWMTACYSVLIAWSLFYMFNSFYSPPRWTRCANTWNSQYCREHFVTFFHDSSSEQSASVDISSNSIYVLPNSTDASHTTEAEKIILEEATAFLNYSTPVNGTPVLLASDINITDSAYEFFENKMLEVAKGIENLGELRFELLAAVLFVLVLVYFAIRKPTFFRGKTIYILTVTSHLLLFSLFFRALMLDGAQNGLHYFFKPQWNKIADARVWIYALAQVLHSFGVTLGPNIVIGSCNKQHNNLLRDVIVLTVVNILTVILIGSVIFGTVGHLALKINRPLDRILHDDPGLVFVVYSVIIGTMPLPSFWAALFFLMFICLGMDSQVKLMATIVSSLKEAYSEFIKQRFRGHSLFLVVVCTASFFATILYVTQAGIFFFQLSDHYVAVAATSVIAVLEVITVGWIYGGKKLACSIQQLAGKVPSCYYQCCWMVLTPLTIMIVLSYGAATMTSEMIKRNYIYPPWAIGLGWISFIITVCWVPILAIIAYRETPKANIITRLQEAIQPRLHSASDPASGPKAVIVLNGFSSASEALQFGGKQPEACIVSHFLPSHERNTETPF